MQCWQKGHLGTCPVVFVRATSALLEQIVLLPSAFHANLVCLAEKSFRYEFTHSGPSSQPHTVA